MNAQKKLDALWGSQLLGFEFDVLGHVAQVDARVHGDDYTRDHRVLFRDVTDVVFHSAIELPWNYVEITQVSYSYLDGRYRVEFLIWSEPTALAVIAGEVIVDGLELPTN